MFRNIGSIFGNCVDMLEDGSELLLSASTDLAAKVKAVKDEAELLELDLGEAAYCSSHRCGKAEYLAAVAKVGNRS